MRCKSAAPAASGKFFGPITLVWFVSIAVLGVSHIVDHPEILGALSPHHALRFMWEQPGTTFIILGAVVLCVTGGEALYADLGHFGKKPIRLAWFSIVMPCLTLNYFGQGALLLADPAAVKNPFFNMAPDWAVVPLVGLATMATVIASQALITGAFSVTKQAMQLGYLPRLQVRHTSVRDTGQIYLPLVNWGLFVAIVFAVVMFKSSTNLAAAYGIAVTLDMLITTVLTFFVLRYGWKYPLWLCIASTSVFFVVDLAFFSSNLLKLFAGGWFPLLIGGVVFTLMMTWKQGRRILSRKQQADAIDLPSFLEAVFTAPPQRVEGTAVFLTAETGTVPNALLHNLKHNKVLHEQNLFVTVRNHEVPWIGLDKRVAVESLGRGCWEVVIHYGFKNDPDVPKALEHHAGPGLRRGAHADQLFPVARCGGAAHWQRHGALARKAVRPDAPQRGRRGRVPQSAEQLGDRAGFEDRDLDRVSACLASGERSCPSQALLGSIGGDCTPLRKNDSTVKRADHFLDASRVSIGPLGGTIALVCATVQAQDTLHSL